jgi:hypothetical protein
VAERARGKHPTAIDLLKMMFTRQTVTEKELALIEESGSKDILIYLIFGILSLRDDLLHNIGINCTDQLIKRTFIKGSRELKVTLRLLISKCLKLLSNDYIQTTDSFDEAELWVKDLLYN